jgi:glucose dehydrogenase
VRLAAAGASTRFSELGQIFTKNVDRLQLAWSFSLGGAIEGRKRCR